MNFSENNFISDNWHNLIFVDALEETKRIIGIRKLEANENMDNSTLISYLFKYFDKIGQDNLKSVNRICSRGCCDCCSSDFDISITEYFAILNYIGIKFGKESIKSISEQAKLSLSAPSCLFIDDTDGSCKIYEVRPLICRKYGLYSSNTYCTKLNETDTLHKEIDTSKNTIIFESKKYSHNSIMCQPKRIVHWFANMDNGELKSQRMKDLFYACFNQSIDEFVEILIQQ